MKLRFKYQPFQAEAAKAVVDADDLAQRGVHWLRWDAALERFEVRRAVENLDIEHFACKK